MLVKFEGEIAMSWSSSVTKDGMAQFLEKITGQRIDDLVESELRKRGISFIKKEEIIISVGYYGEPSLGERITLSDGRIIEHKLIRKTSTDDSCSSHYGWCFSDEKPVVKKF